MSLRKLTDSIGVKASGVFIMALQSDILDGRYESIESRYLERKLERGIKMLNIWYRGGGYKSND